jgi:hypothetical protein
MRGRHRLWLAAAVPLLALSLAACGGHGKKPGVATANGGNGKKGTPTPTVSVDPQTAMLNYAKCMREHGVDMPDPQTNGDGGGVTITISGGPKNEAQMNAAQEACKQYMPNGGAPPSMSPEQIEQMRKFAQCMREHGVQMADPDPNNGGISIGNKPAPGPSESAGGMKAGPPDDPNFKAAEEACKDKLPKGLEKK